MVGSAIRVWKTWMVAFSLVTVEIAYSQEVIFRHYSTDEGFTGSGFKTMAQDSLGFLWISSTSGLYRFDGYSFETYQSASISNKVLHVDSYGNLWLTFEDQLARYDRHTENFIANQAAPAGAKIQSVCFQNATTIWIGTAAHGLSQFEIPSDNKSFYSNDLERDNFDANNSIQAIVDYGNSLLLGTKNGLWLFGKKSKAFSRPLCSSADCFIKRDIKKIFVHNEHIWLWADEQLIKVTKEFLIEQQLVLNRIQHQFDFQKKFIDARVKEIAEDNKGKFWIASQGLGLTYYDPNEDKLTNYRNKDSDPHSIPSDVLNHVMVDRDENIWATTVNKGIVQIKKQSLVFHNYLKGISSTGVGILPFEGGTEIFVGTNGSGLWTSSYNVGDIAGMKFERLEMKPIVRGFENVVEVLIGKKNIWIGTMQAGVAGLLFNNNGQTLNRSLLLQHQDSNGNTITDNLIASIWEAPDGRLWVGTFNGFNIINPKTYGDPGSIITYQHNRNNSNSLIHNGVTKFLPEEDGSMLIATFGGIDRVKNIDGPAEIQFEHLLSNIYCKTMHRTIKGTLYITTQAGVYQGIKRMGKYEFTKLSALGDRNFTYLEEDMLGKLWVMSFDGLFYYDPDKDFALSFKKEDGLPSSRSVAAGSSAQTPDGKMVFGNAEGLTVFDPMSLEIDKTRAKPILTAIKINNNLISAGTSTTGLALSESINTVKEITLNHTHQILSLEFSAMDLTAPEKNIYEYQLEGFDDKWITTHSKNRTATYTNLIPGQYKFKVRASNRDGVWGEHITTLNIAVLPPPWKSWWAYTLYAISALLLLWAARRNIIQRERLASELQLEQLELKKTQEVDRLRSTFFTNISHEFRTPLTLIQGPAQNMIDKLKKEKHVKSTEALPQLDLILVNSERLLRLVNQVLELSKLESGGLKKDISEEEIFAFLKMVIGHFSLLSIQKRIKLSDRFPNQAITALFDKDKLEKIVSNLIFNALKFTPENGSILISARIHLISGTTSYCLLLDVTDNGVGIPEDQIGKIFDRFFQVREGDTQNAGAGIGLALSKELSEFLGGSLTVVSKKSQGSTFSLSLPIEVVHIEETIAVNPSASVSSPFEEYSDDSNRDNAVASKPILLIVEDHVDLRKFICLCLGDDYEYLEAGNGKEGLSMATEQLPSLILSDVMMPEMDGIEMCNKIKQDHRTNHIPVILLTAKASNESKLFGLDKGADDYIVKPFNKDELVLKIRNQILAIQRIQEKIRLDLLSGSTIINAISADEKFIARVKGIIEKRISDEKLGVESLAEDVGLSRVQLYRKINALTGMSVNDFIRKLRIQKGAQLLTQHWGTVSEIAYEVGFSNPSYFSKCFKEQFGVIPSSYNNQNA